MAFLGHRKLQWISTYYVILKTSLLVYDKMYRNFPITLMGVPSPLLCTLDGVARSPISLSACVSLSACISKVTFKRLIYLSQHYFRGEIILMSCFYGVINLLKSSCFFVNFFPSQHLIVTSFNIFSLGNLLLVGESEVRI